MLTVEDYAKIRRAKRDGMSIRAIARTFHHSRRKIREVLVNPEPRPYTRTKQPHAPVLGAFKAIIDQILADDSQAPSKQRHSAAKIFRRLRDEHGYDGGYDQVRRYVARDRKRQRQTFIPLDHDPGQRLEADFGHVYVDFPGGRRQVAVLMTAWSYSGFRFAIGLPTERIEAILEGLVRAFEFFECVGKELWWDNPKTVVKQIFKGRKRQMNERFATLASHYMFEPLFCLPASGNEKPYVENSIFDLQRDWCTPVPKVRDLEEFNQYLRRCCMRKLNHRISGKTETVGERFQRDKASALSLPKHPFDACIQTIATVDKYQTVQFDNNRYSVPRSFAFQVVTIKAYVDRIDIVANSTVIATHKRCYQRRQQILQPRHYLAVLGRRPAALDHSAVFRNWQLPACFGQLRGLFEQRHGPLGASRQYIRVLQLLAQHPVERIQKAIEYCTWKNLINADAIINQTQLLAQQQPLCSEEFADMMESCNVQVTRPNLNQFDQLLTTNIGEPVYV